MFTMYFASQKGRGEGHELCVSVISSHMLKNATLPQDTVVISVNTLDKLQFHIRGYTISFLVVVKNCRSPECFI